MMINYVKVIDSLYRLVDFFPDGDPLKHKTKERALDLLKNLTIVSDVHGWASLKKEKASADILDDIEVLKSYLHLGKLQGWVGGVNYLILHKELEKIKDDIHRPRAIIKPDVEIAKKDLEPPVKKLEKKESPEPLRELIRPPLELPKSEDSSKNSIRRQKILHIINNMGKAQVSDIIKEIPKVTKRTIRRDLDDLLKHSKIVRNGEWNKIFYQMG